MSMENRVFGVFDCELPSTKLPTSSDVIKAICFEIKDKKNPKLSAIDSVSKQVNELWQRAGIPTVSKQRVKAKVTDQYKKYYSVYESNRIRTTYNALVESFKVKYY